MNMLTFQSIPKVQISEIEIECGLLMNPQSFLKSIEPLASRFAIITHPSIATLYGNGLAKYLQSSGIDATLFTFPQGEEFKTRASKESLEDQLLENHFGKDSGIIALGGGVVSDLAGFLAATYGRGIPLITIPTSLLAMVDASIGGKNGVNVPRGKNLIGTIFHPRKVFIDPTALISLPINEMRNGIVEMIKHGLIDDRKYFTFLKDNVKQILSADLMTMQTAIFGSCKIKKAIVEKDVDSAGVRNLLNFGHTIGHALENVSSYSISHGEAVAIGILTECYMGVLLGYLTQQVFDEIHEIFTDYSIPLKLPSHLTEKALYQAMMLDKKSLNKIPRFSFLSEIGTPLSFNGTFCNSVDPNILEKALHWMIHDMCSHQRPYV